MEYGEGTRNSLAQTTLRVINIYFLFALGSLNNISVKTEIAKVAVSAGIRISRFLWTRHKEKYIRLIEINIEIKSNNRELMQKLH